MYKKQGRLLAQKGGLRTDPERGVEESKTEESKTAVVEEVRAVERQDSLPEASFIRISAA